MLEQQKDFSLIFDQESHAVPHLWPHNILVYEDAVDLVGLEESVLVRTEEVLDS